ncbi:rab-GTPase-TBC domain-domain-containing protein [Kockovaella imperatae]|uniref:Rab-GTPase-TBC domain-domain-containing protein n=1 Tax=Kockovaella imperatae TaxID=4999 RepID=A0A1Y1U7W4_9TREE|nr:rab-GTPase-TBC domain-domain-containing protein [Kockovaella imperatae]ORX33597.1 rab-GTPase-TBC domain-domain-containing protein [Kockovaella imperatae]
MQLELYPTSLADSRARYDTLRSKYLVAPDGRWAADCSAPRGAVYSASTAHSEADRSTRQSPSLHQGPPASPGSWDPLSLSSDNPWKSWFAQMELRNEIRRDVERTFPDLPYFTTESVRKTMVTVLFIWSMMHPDVGYRQGMHELLAVCHLVIDKDTLDPPQNGTHQDEETSPLATKSEQQIRTEAMFTVLDRSYIEHDAFELFEALMKSSKSSYEWRAEEGPKSTTSPPTTAPIIQRCIRIHLELLRKIDPQLWERLETEGIEAQIWAIRWIRLIFTRELPFTTALRLWDGIFAEDPSLAILDFVVLALLLLIRNELLNADYTVLLTTLLHYPAPSQTYTLSPFLIITQAVFLRDNITPSAGVEIVMQNQDVLGVKAQPPEPEQRPQHRRPNQSGRSVGRGPPPAQAPPLRGVQGFTAGWFERAQAAGIDRAILSTVADLRRNLPDTATAYSYLPTLPFTPSPARDPSGQFSAIPTSPNVLPSHSSPFGPGRLGPHSGQTGVIPPVLGQSAVSTKKNAELELAELRLAMVGMGKVMSDLLFAISNGQQDSASASHGLERIRDTLLGAAGTDIEDIVREWGWHEGLRANGLPITAATVSAGTIPLGLQPEPVPSPDETSVVEDSMIAEDGRDRMALRPTSSRSPRLGESSTQAPTRRVTPIKPDTAVLPGHFRPSSELPSRSDRPSTGLTRVPMPAPSPRLGAVSVPPKPSQGVSQSAFTATDTVPESSSRVAASSGDLGRESLPTTGTTLHGRHQSLRRAPSYDPLGAG